MIDLISHKYQINWILSNQSKVNAIFNGKSAFALYKEIGPVGYFVYRAMAKDGFVVYLTFWSLILTFKSEKQVR